MLSDNAKAKMQSALQPLYTDSDFANVVGDFMVSVNTAPAVATPDSEVVDITK